jgi:hypothetical protein
LIHSVLIVHVATIYLSPSSLIWLRLLKYLSKYFKEEMHIVLDIDGTLINDSGQPRPGLIEFLKWCEITFETVSIWTAAGQPLFKSGWVDHVIKNLLGYPIKLHKVFTANRSTYKRICFDEMYGERVIIKRPKKMKLDMNQTIILDDTARELR